MSADIELLKRTDTYSRTATPQEIEDDLGIVRGLKAGATTPVRKFGGRCRRVGPIILVGGFLAGMANASSEIFIVAGVLGLAVTIAGFVMGDRSYGLWQMDKLETASSLLRRVDWAPGNVTMRIALETPIITATGNREKMYEIPSPGLMTGKKWGERDRHEDAWLTIEGTLANGSSIRITRKETTYTETHSQYISNGISSRIAISCVALDGVELRYDAARYPNVAAMGPAVASQLRLSEGDQVAGGHNEPGALAVHVNRQARGKITNEPHELASLASQAAAFIDSSRPLVLVDREAWPAEGPAGLSA